MKILLRISKLKPYLRILRTESELLGALPVKLLPAHSLLAEEIELDEKQLVLINEQLYAFALDKLLNYLADAEKTTFDCQTYLKKWYVSENNKKKLIDFAIEKHYLSDQRYAKMFIEEYILFHKSPEEIKAKLILKKIPSSIYSPLLKELYSKESLNESVSDLIEKLISRFESLPHRQIYEKIATTLYRKGYRYDDFKSILLEKLKQIDIDD